MQLFEESFDEKEIIKNFRDYLKNSDLRILLFKENIKKKIFMKLFMEEIVERFFVYENNLKYKIDFKNRNIGLLFRYEKR